MSDSISISVAMATYNGCRYLSQQLESIASQKALPLELVVCDDGSTDNTLTILENFSAGAPFPVRIYQNVSNLGFADNFLKAARLCSGDFVAFCDQDDVWFPNKLKDALECAKNNPVVNLILQKSNIQNEGAGDHPRIYPDNISQGYYGKNRQPGFWVWLGFLQTFRSSILQGTARIDRPRNYFPGHRLMSHDKLTCLLANALGGIAVIDRPAAIYRRHANALTGDHASQTLRQRLDKALPVGSDHYAFLAEVAEETAEYLRCMAKGVDPAKSKNLRVSADWFDKISIIHAARSKLYSSDHIIRRAYNYARISASGGYVGPPIISLGWKSAAKDLLRVLGVIGRPRPVQSP